ncbi:MAG: hypothetical protein M0Z36_02555 [Thermaerobacter sp.]|nr:hypothetical protein [Thermaerobacter sp.]
MAIIWLYALFLLVAWSAPSLLTLSRYTYGITTGAHFVTFLVSVVLFVLMGKSLRKRHKKNFWPGFWTGAGVAAIGTGITQYIRHLPRAQEAFLSQLPGVPPQAARTMLELHVVTSAILSALMFAILYGGLGAIATWWGGRQRRSRHQTNPLNPKEDPST